MSDDRIEVKGLPPELLKRVRIEWEVEGEEPFTVTVTPEIGRVLGMVVDGQERGEPGERTFSIQLRWIDFARRDYLAARKG